jgi:hypothetical protein
MKLLKVCHHDVPEVSDDEGAFLREAASQSAGYDMGQDLFDSHDQMMRRGGPEQVIKDAVKRIEKGGAR